MVKSLIHQDKLVSYRENYQAIDVNMYALQL